MSIQAGDKVKVQMGSQWYAGAYRRGWYVAVVESVYDTDNMGTRVDVVSKTLGRIKSCDPSCVRAV